MKLWSVCHLRRQYFSCLWGNSVVFDCGVFEILYRKSIQRIGFSEQLVLVFRFFFFKPIFSGNAFCLREKAVNYMILLCPSHKDTGVGATPWFGSQQQNVCWSPLLLASFDTVQRTPIYPVVETLGTGESSRVRVQIRPFKTHSPLLNEHQVCLSSSPKLL